VTQSVDPYLKPPYSKKKKKKKKSPPTPPGPHAMRSNWVAVGEEQTPVILYNFTSRKRQTAVSRLAKKQKQKQKQKTSN
jgi:hypothetical protein